MVFATIIPNRLEAQVVAVGAPGGPVTADQNGNLSISVGEVSTDLLIRIYDPATCDPNTAPTHSVGTVTITGSATSTGRLRVLVANCDEQYDFDPISGVSTAYVPEGVVDFGHPTNGGLIIYNPGDSGDTSLRDASYLALAAQGDVMGDIDVGRVFRIQAFGYTVGTPPVLVGGTISSDITSWQVNDLDSTSLDRFEPISLCAIKTIVAGKAITGTVKADTTVAFDPAETDTYASIGRIAVGPGEDAAGITGNILASKGRVVGVYSTGPIGGPTSASTIIAANGIYRVQTSTPDSSSLLARNMHLNLNAGSQPHLQAIAHYEGPLANLRTAGSISGSISATNLSFANDDVIGGIVARGPITASIAIQYNMVDSNIIGSSITGPVTIGFMAQGCIVATGVDENDANAGHISAVQIGYGSVPQPYSDVWRRGFLGSNCPPVNAVNGGADWYLAHCAGGGTSDSVIRAGSIGSVRISIMSQVYGALPGFEILLRKAEVPRIEAGTIGSLEIGDMRAGVVWSGELEFENDLVSNDPENDYALVHALTIGCVGPGADLWFRGCERAEFLHDVFGELHLPALGSNETIWIGDRLGDGPSLNVLAETGAACMCENYPENECFYTTGSHVEDSPRQPGYAAVGAILIRESEGLQGQVIINGNNTEIGEDGWLGVVAIGMDDLLPAIVLGPGETDPLYHAPYYELPSSEVGGGAVGLAPFAFYPQDCTPPHGELNEFEGEGVTLDDFDNNAVPVRLRWYGPVTLPTGINSLNAVLELECRDPNNACNWVPLGGLFSFVADAGGQGRAIGLRSAVGAMPKSGVYRVRYDDAGTPLASNDVDGHPPVGPFPEPGCENDEEAYTVLVRPGDEEPNSGELCDCDWDQDGYITIPDLFAYLSAWFADTEATGARCFWVVSPQTCGVTGLFNFLSCWFSTGVGEACSPP